MKTFTILLALAALTVTSQFARANSFDTGGTAHVVYKGRPLAVEIPVGKERLLEFRKAVKIAVPSELRDAVKVESIAGTIYITSHKPFDSRRFRVEDLVTGDTMLLDISAIPRADNIPLRVLDDAQATELAEEREERLPEQAPAPGLVTITRHAFQQVYAPDRLIEPVEGMYPTKLKNDDALHRMVPGENVLVKPLAQWRVIDGRYVTALYVSNEGPDRVFLDPRVIRVGEGWVTASFRDGVLTPAGHAGDATTLVVVSDRSWTGSTQWLR